MDQSPAEKNSFVPIFTTFQPLGMFNLGDWDLGFGICFIGGYPCISIMVIFYHNVLDNHRKLVVNFYHTLKEEVFKEKDG
jgi:hypothetical protein